MTTRRWLLAILVSLLLAMSLMSMNTRIANGACPGNPGNVCASTSPGPYIPPSKYTVADQPLVVTVAGGLDPVLSTLFVLLGGGLALVGVAGGYYLASHHRDVSTPRD